jgi:hypothetical protein
MIRTLLLAAAGLALVAASPPQKQENGLRVRAGESWIFRIQDGQVVDARKVDGNAEPAKGELKVKVSSMMGTMMTITNNSDTWYNYHAFLGRKRTSVCTLMGGGRGAFENWPGAISEIRIADFTPAPEGEMSCQ